MLFGCSFDSLYVRLKGLWLLLLKYTYTKENWFSASQYWSNVAHGHLILFSLLGRFEFRNPCFNQINILADNLFLFCQKKIKNPKSLNDVTLEGLQWSLDKQNNIVGRSAGVVALVWMTMTSIFKAKSWRDKCCH